MTETIDTPAEGIYTTKVVLPADAPPVLWLTRDSEDATGVMSGVVEVWGERPTRSRAENGLGASWFPTHVEHEGLLCRVTVAAAEAYFNVAPGTDMEIIRVGR